MTRRTHRAERRHCFAGAQPVDGLEPGAGGEASRVPRGRHRRGVGVEVTAAGRAERLEPPRCAARCAPPRARRGRRSGERPRRGRCRGRRRATPSRTAAEALGPLRVPGPGLVSQEALVGHQEHARHRGRHGTGPRASGSSPSVGSPAMGSGLDVARVGEAVASASVLGMATTASPTSRPLATARRPRRAMSGARSSDWSVPATPKPSPPRSDRSRPTASCSPASRCTNACTCSAATCATFPRRRPPRCGGPAAATGPACSRSTRPRSARSGDSTTPDSTRRSRPRRRAGSGSPSTATLAGPTPRPTTSSSTATPSLGYAICGRAGRRGFVQRLAVDPARHGSGVGRALVLDGLGWLRRRGRRPGGGEHAGGEPQGARALRAARLPPAARRARRPQETPVRRVAGGGRHHVERHRGTRPDRPGAGARSRNPRTSRDLLCAPRSHARGSATAWTSSSRSRVEGAPAGAQLQLTVHDRVTSRSAFARSLDGEGLAATPARGPRPCPSPRSIPMATGSCNPPCPSPPTAPAPSRSPSARRASIPSSSNCSTPTARCSTPSAPTWCAWRPSTPTATPSRSASLWCSPSTLRPPTSTLAPSRLPDLPVAELAAALAEHPDVPVNLAPTPETLAAAAETGASAVAALAAALDGSQVLARPVGDARRSGVGPCRRGRVGDAARSRRGDRSPPARHDPRSPRGWPRSVSAPTS